MSSSTALVPSGATADDDLIVTPSKESCSPSDPTRPVAFVGSCGTHAARSETTTALIASVATSLRKAPPNLRAARRRVWRSSKQIELETHNTDKSATESRDAFDGSSQIRAAIKT